jgi:tRNA pseudouridine55 synthase
LHGFLNIDKPQGMTSFDVIRKIKPVLPRQCKLGHLGTLDPMASGVLPIAVGKATRVIPFIENEDKSYIATMTLGVVSDTQDAWGQITCTENKQFQVEKLKDILKGFTGRIKQIPPMYSAVHHQGKRLYELARQGVTVAREEREIVIYALNLLEINEKLDLPQVKIQVDCSKGTYVRTLCHDIGQVLETGALLSSLQRTRSGPFTIDQAYPLQQILQDKENISQYLLALDYPLANMPAIYLKSAEEADDILNGRAITINEEIADGMVRVFSTEAKLLALARNHSREVKPGLIKPERVFK